MQPRAFLLALIVSASLLSSCWGVLFNSAPQTRAVALADLDGDGDLDAYAANGKSEGVEPDKVWLNDGTGKFSDSGQTIGKWDGYDVVLRDVDHDGDADALVANSGATAMWSNNGAGTFSSRVRTFGDSELGAYHFSLGAGDLDGDGDLDIFMAGCCGAVASGANWTRVMLPYNTVWLNDGQGNFRDTGQRLQSLGSSAVAVGDLDGDGDLDAFVGNSSYQANTSANPVGPQPNTVWLNDGSGQFADSGQQLGQADTYAVALGDLDGDGDLDAFVGNDGPNEVWLNDGLGNFSDSAQALGNSRTRFVTLQDLDADGDADAVVGNETGAEAWLNDGLGNFSNSGQKLSYSKWQAVTAGDVDGDGDPDLFATGIDDYKVWLNDGLGNFALP